MKGSMARTCTNHCRTCDGHFTSLEAFDTHRSNYECTWPDDAPLIKLTGACTIGDPDTPQVGIRLYEHARAQRLRDYHRAENGPQAVSTERKSASLAA